MSIREWLWPSGAPSRVFPVIVAASSAAMGLWCAVATGMAAGEAACEGGIVGWLATGCAVPVAVSVASIILFVNGSRRVTDVALPEYRGPSWRLFFSGYSPLLLVAALLFCCVWWIGAHVVGRREPETRCRLHLRAAASVGIALTCIVPAALVLSTLTECCEKPRWRIFAEARNSRHADSRRDGERLSGLAERRVINDPAYPQQRADGRTQRADDLVPEFDDGVGATPARSAPPAADRSSHYLSPPRQASAARPLYHAPHSHAQRIAMQALSTAADEELM